MFYVRHQNKSKLVYLSRAEAAVAQGVDHSHGGQDSGFCVISVRTQYQPISPHQEEGPQHVY